MANVSRNYPFELPEADLKDQVKDLVEEIFNAGGQINTVMQFGPLISLGQIELQSRQIVTLIELTKQNAAVSDINARSSNRLAKAAILIAILLGLIQVLLTNWSNQNLVSSLAAHLGSVLVK